MRVYIENKNKKRMMLSIIVVTIFAIIIWILGYYSLNIKIKEKENNKERTEERKVEKLEEQEKKDISSKISQILKFGYRIDKTISIEENEKITYTNFKEEKQKNFYTNNMTYLKNRLENKPLTKEEKNYLILKQMTPTRLTINTQDIKNEIIKEIIMQDESLNIRTDVLQINAKDVEEKYKEFFVDTIKHETINGCPSFYYDKVNQVYYYIERCGGTSLTNTYVSTYKSNYKKVEDKITVELTLAYIEEITEEKEKERGKKAGIYIAKNTNFKEETRLDIGTEFKIDENNKKDFDTYEFVFKKDKNNYTLENIKKKWQ